MAILNGYLMLFKNIEFERFNPTFYIKYFWFFAKFIIYANKEQKIRTKYHD